MIRSAGRRFAAGALLLAPLYGCAAGGHSLGGKVTGDVQPVSSVQRAAPSTPLTIRGKMTQRCPVAGCWFDLRDSTGSIRVDTKAAGFVMLSVPIGSTVTVRGTVAGTGADREIDAIGVTY